MYVTSHPTTSKVIWFGMGHNNKDTHLQQMTQEVEVVHFHVPAEAFQSEVHQVLRPPIEMGVVAVELEAGEHFEGQAPHGPKVNGEPDLLPLTSRHFGRHESWRAANSAAFGVADVVIQLLAQSKVT